MANHAPRIVYLPAQLALWASFFALPTALRAQDIVPLEVLPPPATAQPKFQNDILPLLKKKCLACHNASTAEGDVILESTQSMLSNEGDEPLLTPGDAAASRLWRVAAHRAEPLMPPDDNDVGAEPLTPTELGVLKLWIDRGAEADDDDPPLPQQIAWRPLPPEYSPILATTIAEHGALSVAARGNQIEVDDLVRAVRRSKLVDPALEMFDPGFHESAHLDLVRSLAIHDEGEWIASGGYRTVKLWRRIHPPRPAQTSMAGVAIAATDGWAATGDATGAIIGARREPSEKTYALAEFARHPAKVLGMELTHDNQRLVSVSVDGEVHSSHIADGKLQASWKLTHAPRRMALIADDLLVTAGDELAPRLWKLEVPNGESTEATAIEPLRAFRGHGRAITALAVVPGEARAFASGSVDGSVRVWDADSGNERSHWIHGEAVQALAVSPDGTRIVSAGADGMAKIWTKEQADPLVDWKIGFPAARKLARLEQDVEIADANAAAAEQALEAARKQLATDQETLAKTERLLADAERILTEKQAAAQQQGSDEEAQKAVDAAQSSKQENETAHRRAAEGVAGSQRVMERATASHRRARQVQAIYRQTLDEGRTSLASPAPIASAAFSVDGNELMFVDHAGYLFLFDAVSGAALEMWPPPSDSSTELLRAAETHAVAALDAYQQGSRGPWHAPGAWRLACQIGGPDDPASPLVDRVLALDFSPDGKLLAVGGGEASRSGQVVVWNIEENRLQYEIDHPHDDSVLGIEFSRDGQYLATSSSDRMMRVFRAANGDLVRTFEGHMHHVLDVAWRANQLQLATCSADKTIKIWEFETGEQLRAILGAGKEVTGIDFLGIANQLVAASGDGTARILNVDDGATLRSFSGGAFYLYCCAATEPGDAVVTGGADQVLRIWDAATGAERTSFPP